MGFKVVFDNGIPEDFLDETGGEDGSESSEDASEEEGQSVAFKVVLDDGIGEDFLEGGA